MHLRRAFVTRFVPISRLVTVWHNLESGALIVTLGVASFGTH
jgi:hypothetical protein